MPNDESSDRPTPGPALAGLHHLTLTVSDLDASVEWYVRVLGFTDRLRIDAGGLRKAMLTRPDAFTLTFVSHGDSAIDGDFEERRVGLDHVAFAVADRAALDEWVEVLDAHRVVRSEPVQATRGWVLSFRDPDNIALEFYTL